MRRFELDGTARTAVRQVCNLAQNRLHERHFEQLCATAPYIEAMTQRLNRSHEFYEEPSTVFVMTPNG